MPTWHSGWLRLKAHTLCSSSRTSRKRLMISCGDRQLQGIVANRGRQQAFLDDVENRTPAFS